VVLIVAGGLIGVTNSVAAAGASLKISPTAGVYEVGGLLDVSFVLDTGGEAVNAVNADIIFPPDKLQVVNPAATTSFISIWVTTPTYSNTDGTIKFQGGLPNPGIKTSAGVISTVTFRVKSSGRASLKFAPTSQVLRNDGQGTNILTSTGTAEFTLKTPPPNGPAVTSPSHSDPNTWYNNPQVQLSWEPVEGAQGYSYEFNQSARTIPDETIDATKTAVSVKADSDGVWYFHIRAKTAEAWGGVTTYIVQIDATPPAAFTPKLDRDIITIEESNTLRFLTTDGASGIDHYEVRQVTLSGNDQQSNTLFVEASSPYIIPKLGAGEYEFIVRAFDRAGNVTEGSAQMQVVAGGLPLYARVPFLRNPAVANGVLIFLVLVAFGFASAIIVRRLRVRATFEHDLNALQEDARRKAIALQKELEELRQAQGVMQQNFGPPPSQAPPAPPPQSPPPAPPTNPPVSPLSL